MDKLKKINICIIRNDKMGDLILTLPIIKSIKANYPYSNIFVVCSNTNAFLCNEAAFIDECLIFDKNVDFVSKINFIFKFSKISYDIIFNFSQDIETFLLLLSAKSTYKSNLIYLSRYGNPRFSKIFQRLITYLLRIDNVKIDRNKYFENKLNFHQSEIMYQVVKKILDIKKTKVFHLIPLKNNLLEKFQKRILIHLSSKWIDNKYSEEYFLELLKRIEKKYGKIYLTTDHSSKRKFHKIFQLFEKCNDDNLNEYINSNQNIIILDKLNFKNWRAAILKSKLVITYECGCVHVASMSDVPLLVVYDYKNKPYMINQEYAPYTKKYQTIITSQEQINQEIMLKLEKMKTNIFH